MLVTPSLNQFENNSSIDGNLENIFHFNVVGGDLVAKNRLCIQNIANNETIYNEEQVTYSLKHIVPSGTLTNGDTYKARIATYNQQGEISEWSEWLIFTAYSTPVVTFTNLGNGGITSERYIFTASYSQAESVQMKSYRFLLYNSNKNLISESGILTNKEIKYEVSNFENDESYFVEFRVTSMSNVTVTTGLNAIHMQYIKIETGNVLDAINNMKDATIDLKIKANNSRFAVKDGEISYFANDYVDLYNGTIYTDQSLGFKLNNDKWTLQLRFTLKEVGDGEILRITDTNSSHITFERVATKIFIRHYVKNSIIVNTWVSIGEVVSDDIITIIFKKDGVGFDKHCIIKRDDRINLWTNEQKDVLTDKNREILITRREIAD